MFSSSMAAYIGGFSVRWIDLGITDILLRQQASSHNCAQHEYIEP